MEKRLSSQRTTTLVAAADPAPSIKDGPSPMVSSVIPIARKQLANEIQDNTLLATFRPRLRGPIDDG